MSHKGSEGPQLTVGELVEQLKAFDPSFKVYTEGCDCWGWATRVSASTEEKDPNYVLIER